MFGKTEARKVATRTSTERPRDALRRNQDNTTNNMVAQGPVMAVPAQARLTSRGCPVSSDADDVQPWSRTRTISERSVASSVSTDTSDTRHSLLYPPSPLPRRCSTLHPGTKFSGYQTSGEKRYTVEVRIKEVDLSTSYLCGDLIIYGLTPQYPELATYFDAEIVGDRYDFRTGKWNSSFDTDLEHWRRFEHFKAIEKQCVSGDYVHDVSNSDVIFMRWKERFIVPVQKESKLKGATFAGFYYICFNRRSGRIDGLYYHAESEMYQRLYLTLNEDRKFGSCEFR